MFRWSYLAHFWKNPRLVKMVVLGGYNWPVFLNPRSVKNEQIVLKFGMVCTLTQIKIIAEIVFFIQTKKGVCGVLIGLFFWGGDISFIKSDLNKKYYEIGGPKGLQALRNS